MFQKQPLEIDNLIVCNALYLLYILVLGLWGRSSGGSWNDARGRTWKGLRECPGKGTGKGELRGNRWHFLHLHLHLRKLEYHWERGKYGVIIDIFYIWRCFCQHFHPFRQNLVNKSEYHWFRFYATGCILPDVILIFGIALARLVVWLVLELPWIWSSAWVWWQKGRDLW